MIKSNLKARDSIKLCAAHIGIIDEKTFFYITDVCKCPTLNLNLEPLNSLK
jgi:hypothetical protein